MLNANNVKYSPLQLIRQRDKMAAVAVS